MQVTAFFSFINWGIRQKVVGVHSINTIQPFFVKLEFSSDSMQFSVPFNLYKALHKKGRMHCVHPASKKGNLLNIRAIHLYELLHKKLQRAGCLRNFFISSKSGILKIDKGKVLIPPS